MQKKSTLDGKGPRTPFELIEVREAKPLEGFKAHVVFTDDTERDIDLGQYLNGPIFEPIRNDPAMFRDMRIAGGTIAWSNEADIAPETLYYGDEDPPWIKKQATQARGSHSERGTRALPARNGRAVGNRTKAKKKIAKPKLLAKPRR